MEPLLLNFQQICIASGQKRDVVFCAIAAGHLSTCLVGQKRFSTPADVRDWVDFLRRESDAGRPVKYRARDPHERPTQAEHRRSPGGRPRGTSGPKAKAAAARRAGS